MSAEPITRFASAGTAGVAGTSLNGVADALPTRVGSRATWQLFERAGLLDVLRSPPQGRVDDSEVRRLHRVLRDELGVGVAREVARDAGLRAADHLLAHHIPRVLQVAARTLPARLAARLLLAELARHAWTFAGDGQVRLLPGSPVVITIRGNPLCKGVHATDPTCDFVSALFERLFAVLVHREARAVEVACESCGAPECRFEIAW